jgi:hypothetical protein
MRFGPTKNFTVKGCYHAMNFGGATYLRNEEVWNSLAPPKMQDFRLADLAQPTQHKG